MSILCDFSITVESVVVLCVEVAQQKDSSCHNNHRSPFAFVTNATVN